MRNTSTCNWPILVTYNTFASILIVFMQESHGSINIHILGKILIYQQTLYPFVNLPISSFHFPLKFKFIKLKKNWFEILMTFVLIFENCFMYWIGKIENELIRIYFLFIYFKYQKTKTQWYFKLCFSQNLGIGIIKIPDSSYKIV